MKVSQNHTKGFFKINPHLEKSFLILMQMGMPFISYWFNRKDGIVS